MFGWLKRMRRKALGSSDRADRNAVIRRIVAAAADESRNRTGTSDSTVVRPVGSSGSGSIAHEPPRFTQDGQPITPLPAGKPSSVATPLPEGSRLTPTPISRPTPTPMVSILEASGPPLEGEIPREKIAQRAMEIWVRKGRPAGTSESDWVQAEAELRAELLYMPSESPSTITRKPR